MDRRLVIQVLEHLYRGDRVFFGFDHFGVVRIKVKHGPFNMFTTHHQTDQETFNEIQKELSLDEDQSEGATAIDFHDEPEAPPAESTPVRGRRSVKRRKARPFKQNGVRSEPQTPECGGGKLNGLHETHDLNGVEALNGSHNSYRTQEPCQSTAANGMNHADETAVSARACPNLAGHLARSTAGPSEQWTKYSKAYRRRRAETERERQESKLIKRIEAEEIESHRFSLVNVDGSWDDLLAGEVSHVAAGVWRGMERTRSVHQLAEELHIPLRECVFWLCVFKRHMGVWVEMDEGRYHFLRPEGEADLALAIRARHQPMYMANGA